MQLGLSEQHWTPGDFKELLKEREKFWAGRIVMAQSESQKLRSRISDLESMNHDSNEFLAIIDRLEVEVAEKDARITALRRKVTELADSLTERRHKAEGLQQKVDAMQTDAVELHAQMSAAQSMLSACEAANLEAKKENNLAAVERERSAEHVRGLEKQLDEWAAVRRELERQLSVALEQKDAVIKRLAVVQAEAASAVAAANVDERDAQTQRERTELKQQLETSKGEANAALSRHAASQAMLANESEQLKAQLAAALRDCESAMNESRELTAELNYVQRGQASLNLAVTEVAQLKVDLGTETKQCAALRDELEALQKQMAGEKTESAVLRAGLEALQKQITVLAGEKEQCAALRAELEALQKQTASERQAESAALAALRKQVELLTAEKLALASKLEISSAGQPVPVVSRETEESVLQTMLAEARADAQKRLDQLQAKLADAESVIEQTKIELEQARMQLAALKAADQLQDNLHKARQLAKETTRTPPSGNAGSAARSREAAIAWSAAAFLDHRQRNPDIPHPILVCRERDRSDYTCQLCWQLLIRPILINNGDSVCDGVSLNPCGDGPYCDGCIRRHLTTSSSCPACSCPTRVDHIIDDTRTERLLRGVTVKCAWILEGCDWRGEIRDFGHHQRSCGYSAQTQPEGRASA
jgi:chromosome segregation ATPase